MPFPHDHYIEASHVDYKERLEEKKPRSWLKSVSAFANTEGGHLIFGAKNEPREVVGLVTDDGQITNGGLLLCDQGVLKQSRIFCTRWKGNYKGSIEEDALDDKEFQGASLITLLQNAEDFVRNNSKNPWSIRGMTREERSDYPYKAVREVLVNALIHRNYQILGSEIHVEVFDDRLEITSPGGMMNGRRVQDMDIRHIPSMRRNQVISDVFSRLGFMERRGSGIDRILNSYVEVAQKPTFYSDSDFFIVTLPNRSVATPAQISMESVEAQPAKVSTSSKKVATSTLEVATPQEKVETSTLKVATSEKEDMDSEVANFKIQLDETSFGSRTKEKTLGLFKRYRYEYSFHSINVAQFFDVKISRANAIIRDLRRLGIVESPQYGVYQFIRK